MNSKNTISITEARKRIFEIAQEVQKPDRRYVLTENGKPQVVVMSYEEFENLMDDIEIYSDPGYAKRIAEAEAEIDRGEYVTWKDLKKELGLESPKELVLADSGKKKYTTKIKK